MKRPSKSFEIALSAIACAVASLALTLASYVDFMLAAGYLLAIFALMVPLSKNFIWGEALALAGAVLLAFFFGALARFFYILPFAVFFGLHPLVNHLQMRFSKKKLTHVLIFIVKAVWFDLTMWLAWVVTLPLLGIESATWYPFVAQNFYYILFLGGTVFFAAYDFLIILCQRSVDKIIARIRR